MPFLRFTRDKRGYETTALVHASRRHGRARQRILYWFRTPPGVKVGRPALDEEAIRWIEEHNPKIEFNWPKILEAQPPAAAPTPPGDVDRRRGRRERADRRRQLPQPRPSVQELDQQAGVLNLEPGTLNLEPEADLGEIAFIEPAGLPVDLDGDEEEVPAIEEAIEQLTHPDADKPVDQMPDVGTPVEKWIPREALIRLRARFAELQARITERGGDAARIEALRAEAESLNPDAWVTEEESRKGLEVFEPRIRELRAALGLRRRRRSRRGGRRRRHGGPAGTASAPPTPEPSNGSGETN